MTFPYEVTIHGGDYETLNWLADRGYDARFCDLAEEAEEVPGGSVWRFTEPQAWEFRDEVDSDPHAFLTSCGSDRLARAMLGFLEAIVS